MPPMQESGGVVTLTIALIRRGDLVEAGAVSSCLR
jgi:hypothetical protein